jgi:hypothetical protein
MSDRTGIPRWAVAGIAVALFTLLAVAAIGARHIPSGSGDAQLPMDRQTIQRVLVDTMSVLLVVSAIWLMLPRKGVKRRRPPVKRTSWLTAVIVLTAMFLIFLRLGKMSQELEPAPEGSSVSLPDASAPTATSLPPRSTLPVGSPDVLLLVVGGVLLAAVGLAAIRRASEGAQMPSPPATPDIVGVIDDLIDDLERSSDPRRIVIGAYARMERSLARDGLARRKSEAPQEYLRRALEHLHVSSQSVTRLTDLFTEARFSPHEIDETMAAEARAALSAVRDELGVSA